MSNTALRIAASIARNDLVNICFTCRNEIGDCTCPLPKCIGCGAEIDHHLGPYYGPYKRKFIYTPDYCMRCEGRAA